MYVRTWQILIMDTLYIITAPFPPHPVPAPGVNVTRVTSSQVEYETTAHGSATRVIAGYEVTRFGVTMIGQYVNTGRGSRVTISPAVPGAQYRITAWALGDGRRSATPAVVDATTKEAGEIHCPWCTVRTMPAQTHTCADEEPFISFHCEMLQKQEIKYLTYMLHIPLMAILIILRMWH